MTHYCSSLSKKAKTLIKKTGSSLFMLVAATMLSNVSHAQGIWTPLLSAAPDYNAGVMLLLTDGSILVKTSAGADDDIGSAWDRLYPDIHGSYVHGTWVTAGIMADSRLYFSTQILKNGTIYAAGGEYGTGRTRGEVYYPQVDVWVPLPALPDITDTISDANSEILPDGKVLQAVVSTGGTVSHRTYIFDPALGTYGDYILGPSTIGYDNESAWLKLPDNSILYDDIYSTNSERYIPALNNWVADNPLPVGLYDPYGFEEGAAFLLPDGRGFFIGSASYTAYYTPSGTNSPGTWTAGPSIPDSLGAPDAASAMMVDGKIICAFAPTPVMDTVFKTPTTYYEFDYLTNTFTRISAPDGTDSLDAASYISNMLLLPDGNVLYASQGDDQYYVYTPSGTPLAAGKPTIDTTWATTTNCDTFMATGHLFNGITEGAGYGDDWQMNTNYPLVRLSHGDTVIYATTYNWNSTGVMRGTKKDTTTFVVPVGLAPGTYNLQVVANGNASAPVSFVYCPPPVITGVKNVVTGAVGMNIYPNPANNVTTVAFTCKNSGKYSIKLVDLYGKTVRQFVGTAINGENSYTLGIDDVAKGVYTVTLRDNDGVLNSKVTIE